MKFLANIQKDGMDVAAGIAGGAIGRVLTNKVGDKLPLLKDKPKLRPAAAFVAGLLAMGASKGMPRELGRGMAIVAGTDLLGNYVPMINAKDISEDLNGMADELADELEQRLSDDITNSRQAVNDNVSNGATAVNDEMNDELSDEMNDELSDNND